MRPLNLMLSALAVAAVFVPQAGHADPYRWCAQYASGMHAGGRNCGFVTLEQCRATVSGIGGFCELNQFYTGPETTGAGPRKRVRRHRHD
jgi:hypothetical protein